jgi:hypothetical protein
VFLQSNYPHPFVATGNIPVCLFLFELKHYILDCVQCLTLCTAASSHLSTESSSKLVKRAANANVCTSELCQNLAKQIKASLAKNSASINPCVDMDAYACDGWRETHDYRPEQNGRILKPDQNSFTLKNDNRNLDNHSHCRKQ